MLDATLAELGEVGYAGLTLEGVARRAGIHKTTLYRRWQTLEKLVLAAMLEQARVGVPVPDTGSLHTDLLALCRGSLATASTPQSQTVLRTVIGIGPRDPAMVESARAFWTRRLAMDAEIVTRAVARGEIPPDTPPEEIVEAALAPIYFRLLVTGEPVDDAYLHRIAARVAAACRRDDGPRDRPAG